MDLFFRFVHAIQVTRETKDRTKVQISRVFIYIKFTFRSQENHTNWNKRSPIFFPFFPWKDRGTTTERFGTPVPTTVQSRDGTNDTLLSGRVVLRRIKKTRFSFETVIRDGVVRYGTESDRRVGLWPVVSRRRRTGLRLSGDQCHVRKVPVPLRDPNNRTSK